MAVAVESPFALNISSTPLDLPQQGTFVAGRRRRINNDPYGGEGYIWEDIAVPPEAHEETLCTEPVREPNDDVTKGAACPVATSNETEHQSVATQRLNQLKQHLTEIIRPKRYIEGFSLDNIHLGLGSLHDWQSPQTNCPRYASVYPRDPAFHQEWQTYAREMLFRQQELQQRIGLQSQDPNALVSHRSYSSPVVASDLHNRQLESRSTRKGASAISFEPLDVTCSSWSSLMAQRRRCIAEIA